MGRKNLNLEMVETEKDLPSFFRIHKKSDFKDIYDNQPDVVENPLLLQTTRFFEHWHKEMEINYILDGECQYYIDGQKYTVRSGEMIIINCESIHRVVPQLKCSQKDKMAFTMLVRYDFIKQIIPDLEQSVFLVDKLQNKDEVCRQLVKIMSFYEKGQTPYWNIKLSAMLNELFYLLCIGGAKQNKAIIPINNQKNVERLRGIMQYVADRYQEPMNQEQVAKRFYFSREYFSRFFKSYTGITFKEYLDRYRLCEAEKLLLETDQNVSDIAINTGFTDSRQLINGFKRYYGVTPYKFKKMRQVTKR